MHSSLQNCPPKHGVPLVALGQWNLHCSWAVLNWRCSTLFLIHAKHFGLHTMVFLSSWEPEWGAGRNWHVRQFSVWTFQTLSTAFQNSNNLSQQVLLEHPSPQVLFRLNPWIRHYMRQGSCNQTALLIENGGLYWPDRYTTWKVDCDGDTCSLSSYKKWGVCASYFSLNGIRSWTILGASRPAAGIFNS